MTYLPSILKNGMAGLIGALDANWSTPPTDLQNITDQNLSTSSGEGVTAQQTPAFASITWDLGAIFALSTIFFKIGLWKDGMGEQANFSLFVSTDGMSYSNLSTRIIGNTSETSTSDTEEVLSIISTINQSITDNPYGRYIQVRLNTSSGTGNAHLKIYEIILTVLNTT